MYWSADVYTGACVYVHICARTLGRASRAEVNLLSETRCTTRMKEMMKARVNKSESFEKSGLTLQIMNLGEFWSNDVFVSTSHEQWRALFQTSEDGSERVAMFERERAVVQIQFACRCGVTCSSHFDLRNKPNPQT